VRKGLISFYKTNKIYNISKKNMDINHAIVVKNFEEKVNCLNKLIKEKQPTKKSSKCV